MNRALVAKASLVLALNFLLAAAVPLLRAQADQWDKHMKSGGKAYAGGMNQKYYHGWGNAGPNPEFSKAEEEFLAALAQAQTFPAGDMRTAETLGALASVYMEEGKFADAESRGNQAIAMMEASAKPDDMRLGHGLIHLALIYDAEGKTEQAAPIWQRSLGILKKSGGVDPDDMRNLNFHADFGNFTPAANAQIYQYILDLNESTGISDTDLRNELGRLARTQRGADAEQHYLRVLEIDKKLYGPDGIKTGGDQEALGKLFLAEGKYAAALPQLQHSLEIMQAKPAPEHESKINKGFDAAHLGRLDRDLAQAYAGAGKDAEAEEIYKRLISMDEADSSGDKVLHDMNLGGDLTGLAGVYRHERRYDEALETIKRSEAIGDEITNSKFEKSREKAGFGGPSVWFWLSQNELAEIYRETGDSAAAEPIFESSLEMTQHMHLVPGHPKLAQMLGNYATLLRDGGKYEQAEALYKRSLEVWAKCTYPENADAAETLTNYAALLRKMKRPAEAEPLEARASAMLTKVDASNPIK